MNDTEIALIAEKHGWKVYHNHYQVMCNGVCMAENTGGKWRLTDSGAFRVLVEAGMQFSADCDDSWYYAEADTKNYIHAEGQDPHTAVAMARLAQLRE